MDASAQEQWVLDQFILGVGSVDLRRHVQFGHPRDVNAAISLAIEFEAFEAGTKDKLRKPVNVNKGDVCAVGADNGSRPESKSNNGESEKKSEGPVIPSTVPIKSTMLASRVLTRVPSSADTVKN